MGVNGTIPGISSAGTIGQTVTIGSLSSSSIANPIILDTDTLNDVGEGILNDGAASIGSLTFNDTTGVEIATDGNSTLTITGSINNATSATQDLALTVNAGTNTSGVTATYTGGSGGGTLNFTQSSTLNIGVSNISTSGTVNVSGVLTFTINASAPGQSHTTFGKLGPVNATNSLVQINPPGTDFTGTYPSVATLAADTGDFFDLSPGSGTFVGATLAVPPTFTDTNLTWITTLFLKGILFVEPAAGGNVINAGTVLPIGNDSEFNPKGTAATTVTLNGGEVLTNNNSSTLDSGGTSGTAYSTTNTIGVNTTGGALAATTGTTATYGGIISNGNGSTGVLTVGDGVNNGAGTVVFSAANSYAGGTKISTGTLQLSGSGKLGATTGALTLSGGTLALAAAGQTVGAISITGASTISTTGGTLTGSSFTDSATSGTTTVSAGLAGTGTVTLSGASTLTLSGSNTYTGATSVSAGTLSQSGTLSGTSGVSTSGSGVFSQTGAGVISGGATFTQGSSGTSVLGGANTYTGATTVSKGTLSVTGSTASGSSVTVGNNSAVATLAGTGTINGSVTTSTTGSNVAHIAPGSTAGTVGTLNLGSKGLTIGNGTALDMDLNTNTGAGGANNDLIKMNGGTLTLSGTTTFNFNPITTLTAGSPYTLISGAATISGFNAANFTTTGMGSLVPVYSTSGGTLKVTFETAQTITFPSLANQQYSGTPIMVPLGATASSNLTVMYTVTTGSGIASVTGSTLTITGSGPVTVVASQGGNGTFAPAPNVSQSLTVSALPISFIAWENSVNFNAANGFTANQTSPGGSAFNDGVPNLLKYLYNINPAHPISPSGWAAMPVASTFSSGGIQYITLTYRQYASDAGSDSIVVSVQTSPDLQNWTTLSLSQTSPPASGTYTMTQIGNDPSTNDPIMVIEAPYTGARQFIRLNASQQ